MASGTDPKDMDQGFGGGRAIGRLDYARLGVSPRYEHWVGLAMVETRRLELLTLSLQRRRSTD